MTVMEPSRIRQLMKAKYVKRTGSPGHYTYVYRGEPTGRGGEPAESERAAKWEARMKRTYVNFNQLSDAEKAEYEKKWAAQKKDKRSKKKDKRSK